MKIIFISLIFWSITIPVILSQSAIPLRVEIPVRTGTNPFNYIAFGEQGICMFYPTSNDVGKDSVSWSFVMMDKNFKEIWRKVLPLHEDVAYLQGFTRNNVIYLLFHENQRKIESNIHVLFVYPAKQVITQHNSSIPDKADVVDFDLYNEYAVIGYNLRKGKPGMMAFSLINGEKRAFEFSAEDDALLLDITVDTIYKDIFAAYKVQPSANKNILKLNQYDGSSALRNTISFENINEKRILNSAQCVITGQGTGFIVGTYGPGNRNRRNYDYYNDYYNYYYYNTFYRRQVNQDYYRDNTPVTDGFYSATFSSSSTGSIQYNNFIDFANSQKYLNDPNAIKVRRKVDRKSGNEPSSASDNDRNVSLEYRLLIHPVYQMKGNYIVAAEAYIPEYHTMTQMVYDYYGRAIPSTYSVFDGYRYNNAFIAAYDSSGTMKWNNGMEMRDVLTSYLNRKLNIFPDNDDIVMYFNANGKLAYKVIRESEIVESTSLVPIAPKRATDQFISEYLGSAEHWYGDYFLVTGYESLRNNSMDESRRNVFYLSKMAFK
jgi:hypothetical protein